MKYPLAAHGHRPPRPRRFATCLAGAWLCLGAMRTGGVELAEYEVKAAFIYNFAKFTEWPRESAKENFHFCVLGHDPFGEALDGLAEKTVRDRPIAVGRGIDAAEAKSCDVLFVHEAGGESRNSTVKRLAGLPILTIGDQPGFAQGGGMIEMVMVDNRVQFEVNLDAVRSAKLKISSQLLKLARKVAGVP